MPLKTTPEPGDTVHHWDGSTWCVSAAWSNTVVLQRAGAGERVIHGEPSERFAQLSTKSWKVRTKSESAVVRQHNAAVQNLMQLAKRDFHLSDQAYEASYQEIVERPLYEQLKLEIQERRAAEAFKRQKRLEREKHKALIKSSLSLALAQSLEQADILNRQVNDQEIVNYKQLRAEYLSSWLTRRLNPHPISDEQIASVGELSRSYLLRARAGSGKTSVITAKAVFLMEHEGVPADQLMILAFNKKAAKEVSAKIRRGLGILEHNNSRTFHSLAYQLVRPRAQPLFDESTGSNQKQSAFIQQLINSVMNPALLAQIYLFFRREIKELEDIGAFLSKDDYYTYRRNHVQESLRGQSVKSVGEKWIADFLFEHGISYTYERVWYWDGPLEGNYHPDFSLSTSGRIPDIVIEHWGIDLNDLSRSVPEHWDQTWQEYRDQIDRKRAYWERHNLKHPDQRVTFLETSVAQLRNGREAFEKTLAGLLRDAGVTFRKLPEEQLQKDLVIKRIARLSTMCLQYIQKAKKQRLSPEDLAEKITASPDLDSKTKAFLRIANGLYRRYEHALAENNLIDFDDLMAEAIDCVHRDKGNCQIRTGEDRFVSMNQLQWIMIDEYQDFSRLFYDLIDAIRHHNNELRLFCVGDDWQAINAFAGSDLKFFTGFTKHLSDGTVGDLRNNYRSAREIVEAGNVFMRGKGNGRPSIPKRHELTGRIQVCHTDKIWIEQRAGAEYSQERTSDERFYTWITIGGARRRADPGLRIGRMLKKCHSILVDDTYDSDTKFAILSRVDQLGMGYPNMGAFHRKLRETLEPDEKRKFGKFDDRVRCGTVHSFKGLEADVVIVLGVNQTNFPKIHPDNELFSIFGVSPAEVFAEEERLFYVAITRAKRDLYLLTETGRESDFLRRIGPTTTLDDLSTVSTDM